MEGHAVGALSNAVGLKEMIEQVLSGLEVFATDWAGLPGVCRRVDVGHVLLQVACTTVYSAALCADRLRILTSYSWNRTTRQISSSRSLFLTPNTHKHTVYIIRDRGGGEKGLQCQMDKTLFYIVQSIPFLSLDVRI